MIYTITDVKSNKHPRAEKIGKIIGKVTVPAGFIVGTAYVIVKTKNV